MQNCYYYSVICTILLTVVDADIPRLRNTEFDTDTNCLQKYYISQSSDVEEPDYLSNSFFLTTSRFGNIEEALLRERNKDILEHYPSGPFKDSVKVIRQPGPNNKDIISLEIRSDAEINSFTDELKRNKRSADDIERSMKQMDITDNPDLLVALFVNILKNRFPEKLNDMKEVLNRITSSKEFLNRKNLRLRKNITSISPLNSVSTDKYYNLSDKLENQTKRNLNKTDDDEQSKHVGNDEDDGTYEEDDDYDEDEVTLKYGEVSERNTKNLIKNNENNISMAVGEDKVKFRMKLDDNSKSHTKSFHKQTPGIIIINSTLNVNDPELGQKSTGEGSQTTKENISDEKKNKIKQETIAQAVSATTPFWPKSTNCSICTDHFFKDINDDDTFGRFLNTTKLQQKFASSHRPLKITTTISAEKMSTAIRNRTSSKRILNFPDSLDEDFYDESDLQSYTTLKTNTITDSGKKTKYKNRHKKLHINISDNNLNTKQKRKFKGLFWRN